MSIAPLIFWGSFLVALIIAILIFLVYVFHTDI